MYTLPLNTFLRVRICSQQLSPDQSRLPHRLTLNLDGMLLSYHASQVPAVHDWAAEGISTSGCSMPWRCPCSTYSCALASIIRIV